MSIIPVFGRWRQEDQEIQLTLKQNQSQRQVKDSLLCESQTDATDFIHQVHTTHYPILWQGFIRYILWPKVMIGKECPLTSILSSKLYPLSTKFSSQVTIHQITYCCYTQKNKKNNNDLYSRLPTIPSLHRQENNSKSIKNKCTISTLVPIGKNI